MSPEDKLQEVLAYAGHNSHCEALQVNWNKGPCNCGWEKIEAKLAKEKEMLNDDFELDAEAKSCLDRWQKVSAKMTEDMRDNIDSLIYQLEFSLKFANGRIWLGLDAHATLAHAIYGVDWFDTSPDYSETGWFEGKGRRGAIEHTRRKQAQAPRPEEAHEEAHDRKTAYKVQG